MSARTHTRQMKVLGVEVTLVRRDRVDFSEGKPQWELNGELHDIPQPMWKEAGHKMARGETFLKMQPRTELEKWALDVLIQQTFRKFYVRPGDKLTISLPATA